jgi:hypothetical protein
MGRVRFIDSVNLQWERVYSRDYEIRVSDEGILWAAMRSFPNEMGGEGGMKVIVVVFWLVLTNSVAVVVIMQNRLTPPQSLGDEWGSLYNARIKST